MAYARSTPTRSSDKHIGGRIASSVVDDVGQALPLEQRIEVFPAVEIDEQLAAFFRAHLERDPRAQVIGQGLFQALGIA